MQEHEDLKSAGRNTVWVRPPPALQIAILGIFWLKTQYKGVFGKENILESPLGVEFVYGTLGISLFSIQQKWSFDMG
ncbi:MAG: hypothetical protein ABSA01_02655 [Anaerolineales bacterium]|jgi:hypothetical protein